jgi:hypothetical protein
MDSAGFGQGEFKNHKAVIVWGKSAVNVFVKRHRGV